MKTRQFRQLGGLRQTERVDLVVEGLRAIGENVAILATELEKCNEGEAFRSAQLVYNAGREEAGKFLILLDAWRAPHADQGTIARHFVRAGNHLSKLIYAQVADYSIASQRELVGAIDRHRQSLHLDGPNDYDWIFRNELLSERENALYVDLVDAEGQLQWWTPHDYEMGIPVPFSMRLVVALLSTNLVSAEGLITLQKAWLGFDSHVDSHCREWWDRSAAALAEFPNNNVEKGSLTSNASFVARQWPMPMVELEVEEAPVTIESMKAERDAAYEAWVRSEFGDPC